MIIRTIKVKKKRNILFLLLQVVLIIIPVSIATAQAQLVFQGDGLTKAYMVMNGGTASTPIYLVVDNADTNAMIRKGTEAGWVISENEFHIVRWNMQIDTGSYTVPFGATTGAENQEFIPLTFRKISMDATDVKFATYGTPADNTLWPTDVNNMDSVYGGSVTDNVLDRFYFVDLTGSATATLDFSYRATENLTTAYFTDNTFAQQWSNISQNWRPPIGPGAMGVASNTGKVPAGVTSLFSHSKVWLLSRDMENPLPISLLAFEATCDGNHIDFTWSTATETNNSYFTVQRSIDAQNFNNIIDKPGAGNSNSVLYYNATDNSPYPGTAYYRLKQTDFDGMFSYSSPIAVEECDTELSGNNVYCNFTDGKLNVFYEGKDALSFTVSVQNMIGQQLISETSGILDRVTLDVGSLAVGIYLVVVRTEIDLCTAKVYIP